MEWNGKEREKKSKGGKGIETKGMECIGGKGKIKK